MKKLVLAVALFCAPAAVIAGGTTNDTRSAGWYWGTINQCASYGTSFVFWTQDYELTYATNDSMDVATIAPACVGGTWVAVELDGEGTWSAVVTGDF